MMLGFSPKSCSGGKMRECSYCRQRRTRCIPPGRNEGDEDHYRDFLRTVGFLLHSPEHEARLGALLKEYRQQLYRLADGEGDGLAKARNELEKILRGVMIRNERLAASKDRNGMLCEVVGSRRA